MLYFKYFIYFCKLLVFTSFFILRKCTKICSLFVTKHFSHKYVKLYSIFIFMNKNLQKNLDELKIC